MDKLKVGQFIANCRKDRKLTQEQLAEKLGISKNAVSKWERGICLMDMSLLKPLSDILQVDVIDILSGEIIDKNDREDKYKNILVKLFGNMKLNKKRLKFQYYLFEILILFLAVLIVILSDQEIITVLTIILMVVANSFNLSFYILAKDVNSLMNKTK